MPRYRHRVPNLLQLNKEKWIFGGDIPCIYDIRSFGMHFQLENAHILRHFPFFFGHLDLFRPCFLAFLNAAIWIRI